MLRGWGRATRSVAEVVPTATADAVAAALAGSGARGALARGLGRAYGDAAQNAGGRVLDATALGGIGPVRDGAVRVGAGVSLAALAERLLPEGWFPAVVPGTRWVTVGGALAADIHGKNHHRDGGFADHVTAFELVTPDGGVRTVTRDGDRAAWDATVGGMGLTGVITAATLRLIPVRSGAVREQLRPVADLDALLAAMAGEDAEHRYSVAWVDWSDSGRSLLMQGDHADGEDAQAALPGPRLRAPRRMPSGLLGRPTVRAFNALWYAVKPRLARSELVPLAAFFWPLDGVRGWNRLYGERGLLQYQCVVPHGAEDVLRTLLARSRAAGVASPLAVLKRLGAGTAPMSFPMRGWTLAIDLPAGAARLGPLLDGFDDLVAEAGGRVYLAKDARLRPGAVAAMYPQLEAWRTARAALDPGGVMRSDLARRLELA